MVARNRVRQRSHNGKWKTITIEQAVEILHISTRQFHRIKGHLQIKRPGRRLLVNEYSVHRYLRNLPDAHRRSAR